MMRGFHRWFDGLPEPRRFVTFVSGMAVLLLVPRLVWLIVGFDPIWLTVSDCLIIGVLGIDRIMYVHRRVR